MAVQGKLVPQDLNDEPASVLLRRIKKEKEELIKEGKIKKSKTESFIFRGADNLHYEQIGKEVRCIEDELPFEIPDNWEWVHINDIAESYLGKTLNKTKDIGESVPYLCSINIQSDYIDMNTIKIAKFNEAEKQKYLLQDGDLLICEGGDAGRSAVWNKNKTMYYQNALHRVRFYEKLNPVFYQRVLSFYKVSKILDNYFKGVTIKHFVQKSLFSIYFPLPPLQEQHRIVAKLQELEPLIEKYRIAEEQLHELNSNIKDQLKKSILQYAIEGKLVPQDPNDEPASVLLERIREEKQQLIKEGKIKKDKNESIIFRRDNSYYEKINGIEYCIDNEIPFEIPNSWQWARLNNIGNWGAGATPSKSNNEYYSNGTIPWLLTGDLNDGYITNIPNHITELALEKTSVKLNPSGSVLIAMYGATIGKLGILTFPATTNQACCACLVYKPFYSKYLFFYLLANKRNFVKKGEGGAQPNISKEKIIKTLIAVPPLKEQIRIVNLLGKVI